MKVLTASSGTRPDDFGAAVPGEIAYLSVVCGRDREGGPGGCGCGRAFAGLASGKPTTVVTVTDLELDRDDLVAMVADRLRLEGWANAEASAEDAADEIADIAADFDVGTQLRRRLDDVVTE